MKIARVLCLFGWHDWHIHEEEPFVDADFFKEGTGGEWPFSYWSSCCMMPALVATGFLAFVSVEMWWSPVILAALGVSLVAIWVSILLYRVRNRRDARCLACGKQVLHLSEYRERQAQTKRFFDELRQMKEDK